ncbi:MAG TPA: hypothetical protein VNA20_15175 [Frankiaceae bacterium]|nr:hypothetical protein [Frankiaceae bacterium]
MRLATAALCAAALAATAVPADAERKPKKQRVAACVGGLQDPRGDSTFRGVPGFESTDILGSGFTATPSTVDMVLRVASSAASGGPRAGARWEYGMAMLGVRHVFSAEVTAAGTARSSATVGGASLAHTFEMKDDLLIWRIKRADVHLRGNAMDLAAETTSVITADTAEARMVRRADGKWCAQRK